MSILQDSIREAKEMSLYMADRDKQRMKRIDYAFNLPRSRKWKAVIEIYLDETPGLKEVRDANVKMARDARDKLGAFNQKAMTGDMQLGMIMPPAYWDIISTCDPEFDETMKTDTAGDPGARQRQIKMFKVLTKTFPEFVVPQSEM